MKIIPTAAAIGAALGAMAGCAVAVGDYVVYGPYHKIGPIIPVVVAIAFYSPLLMFAGAAIGAAIGFYVRDLKKRRSTRHLGQSANSN